MMFRTGFLRNCENGIIIKNFRNGFWKQYASVSVYLARVDGWRRCLQGSKGTMGEYEYGKCKRTDVDGEV